MHTCPVFARFSAAWPTPIRSFLVPASDGGVTVDGTRAAMPDDMLDDMPLGAFPRAARIAGSRSPAAVIAGSACAIVRSGRESAASAGSCTGVLLLRPIPEARLPSPFPTVNRPAKAARTEKLRNRSWGPDGVGTLSGPFSGIVACPLTREDQQVVPKFERRSDRSEMSTSPSPSRSPEKPEPIDPNWLSTMDRSEMSTS